MILKNGYTANIEKMKDRPSVVGNVHHGKRWVGCVVIEMHKEKYLTNISSNEISGFLSLDALQRKINDLEAIKECYELVLKMMI